MTDNIFTSLHAQPSYGHHRTLVAWNLLQGYEDWPVFIYRSFTGEAPWTLVNDVVGGRAVGSRGMSLEDDEFFTDNRLQEVFYRAAAVNPAHHGDVRDGPVVRTLGHLSRREWGGACEMLRREHLAMSRGRNGIPVLHYIPLTEGELSPYFDADTGQHLGPECPDAADPAYGMRYVGGFGPPVSTYIKFEELGPLTLADAQDTLGNDDPLVVRARMLAHPAPRRGHMIVHMPSDNRYVVGEAPKGYFFRGLVAVAFSVSLHLLRRDDPRYRVPVPVELMSHV